MRAVHFSGLKRLGRISGVLAAVFVTSCSQSQIIDLARTTPGTFISSAEEMKIGAQAHPKIVAQFGGIYEDEDLNAYVTDIAGRLKSNLPQPGPPYQITILNSPAINAFAAPGGYIYLTRGLLALANDEAEIASVLAHELGHLTRRHSAVRFSMAVKANIITRIFQAAQEDPELKRNLRLGTAGFLARNSRDQEVEADRISITTSQKTGYDPYAAISFLKTMSARNALNNILNNTSRSDQQVDFLATHPAIGLRKIKAFSFASQLGFKPDEKKRFRNTYLQKINKLRYGNNPDQGIVRGRTFIHPSLGFRFKVPENFRIQNRKQIVVALDPDRNVMLFNVRLSPRGANLEEVLGRHFNLGRKAWNIKRTRKNGLEIVSGSASYRNVDHQIFLIRERPDRIYRFWFISSPDQTEALSQSFRLTATSLSPLLADDKKLALPQRLKILTVRPGDTVAGISERMAFAELREKRFRVLNGLSVTARLKPGQRVKIITN
jgi:predicted Zn-dependent protease